MAENNPSFYGPLKGEILLANGSRIAFDSAEWNFSYSQRDGTFLKATERRPLKTIMAWDPAKDDASPVFWRETTQGQNEVPKKSSLSLAEAIEHAREEQGYSLPLVVTNGELIVRCQFATGSHYIIFKDKECIAICRSVNGITQKHRIDVFKGWYSSGMTEAIWARAQSLAELQRKIDEAAKKQHEPSYVSRLRELIMLTIGRASVCWDRMPQGVSYDDIKAVKLGNKLVDDIAKLIEDNDERL